jgi:hypothetical protein
VGRPRRRRSRFPRGWGVSFSAVELTIENAERLLIDSTKTSPPTSAALAELSVEEAAKAWLLYFRFMAQGRTVRNLPRIPAAVRRAMEAAAESSLKDFQDLDHTIFEAFRDHRVKLRFLGFLLKQLEVSLPIFAKSAEMAQIGQDIQGPAINVREIDAASEIGAIQNLISSFRLEGLTDLDSVKKRGFYVNITDRGDLISPSIYSPPTRLLVELAAFLIVALKGDLVLVSHKLRPRAEVAESPLQEVPPPSKGRAPQNRPRTSAEGQPGTSD